MQEILDDVTAELAAGRPFALVTLVADQGSTPRAAGAGMLVRADGSIGGTVGGGLLEHTLVQAAAEALAGRAWRRERLDLGGTDLASGAKMVCGGAAEALVVPVPPGDPELTEGCAALRAARDAGRLAWFVTVPPAEPGDRVEHCVLDEAGALSGSAVCAAADLRRLTAAAALHGSATLPDGRVAVVERVEPPALAVICGAGHVAQATAPLLAGLGFRVVVVDDRADWASAERFPDAETVVRPFAGALEAVGVDERAYVLVVTRGHVHDLEVLEQALRLGARYVGVMGSRSKRARFLAALAEAGFGEQALASVHTPVGVAIGAETPAELAVSIAAEVVLARSGRAG